jgi:signal transduction histidine kinase/streptogramin lyase
VNPPRKLLAVTLLLLSSVPGLLSGQGRGLAPAEAFEQEGAAAQSHLTDPRHEAARQEFEYLWRVPWLWRSFDRNDIGFAGPYHRVVEDGAGRIWVSGSGGLAFYDGFAWQLVRMPVELAINAALPLFTLHDGSVIAQRDGRLWSVTRDGLEAVRHPEFADKRVHSVHACGARLYLVCYSGPYGVPGVQADTLYEWSAQGLRSLPWPFDEPVARGPRFVSSGPRLFVGNYQRSRVLIEDRWRDFCEGHVISVAENPQRPGLALILDRNEQSRTWTFSGETLLEASPPEARPSYGQTILDLGSVYVRTSKSGELALWNGASWRELRSPDAQAEQLRDLLCDRSSNLWLAGKRELLLRVNLPPRWKRWRHVNPDPGPDSQGNPCLAAIRSSTGDVWMSLRSGVERRSSNGDLLASFGPAELVGMRRITGLAEDELGRIWAVSPSSDAKCAIYDGTSWRPWGDMQREGPRLGLRKARTLARDPEGRILIGGFAARASATQPDSSLEDCLYRWERDSFVPIGRALGLQERQISKIDFAPDGTLWAGGTNGLHRFLDGRWQSWLPAKEGRGRVVWTIEAIDAEHCWFGSTGHGIGRFDPEQGARYLRDDPEANALLTSALQRDERGRLWIGTDSGLACLDGERLRTWDLVSRGRSERARSLLLFEGQLLVASLQGYSWLLDLRPAPLEELLRVENVDVSRQGSTLFASWELQPRLGGERAADFESRFRVNSGEWSSWSGRRQVAVAELPGGTHLFEMQLRDPVSGATYPALQREVAGFPLPFHLRPEFLGPLSGGLALLLGLLGWLLWQRRRVALERRQMEGQLRTSQKLEAVGTLAAGLAHDMNNSLQAILGYADLARDGGPESDEYLSRLVASAERTQGLTRTMLGFARPGQSERQPLELSGFVTELSASVDALLSRQYDVDATAEGELWIDGDRSALQQLVMNLVLNARDAMPEGGAISIRAEARGDQVAVIVRDQGCGIAPHEHERILEPFYTTKPRGQGTGLGLAIVHWVLEEHGARLEIQSELGAGAEFCCFFPRLVAPPLEETSQLPEESGDFELDGAGAVVLVVEDNEQVRMLVCDLLESRGFDCHSCESGTEALECMKELAPRLRDHCWPMSQSMPLVMP